MEARRQHSTARVFLLSEVLCHTAVSDRDMKKGVPQHVSLLYGWANLME